LSLVFGIIVIWAQNDGNAISSAESHPFSQAILIPIHGLLLYFVKAIIPFNLSAMHPYPMMVDGKVPLEILYSFIPLSIIGLVLVKMYWKNRKILFGLAFFIVVIFPVLQFVSVGSAMISERYTYLSYIGLFIVIGLILDKAYTESNGLKKNLIVSLSILYLIFLGFQTHQRTFVWQNDETLWSDVIESYPGDYFGYFKRGSFRAKNGNSDSALVDLNASITIFQNDYYSFNNRGMIYLSKRNYELAEKDFSKAIQIDSTLYEAHLNRGLIYLNTKKYKLAEFDFKKSASIAPNNALCFLNQALLYERMDSFHLAQENYIRALELSPKNAEGYKYRGLFYLKIAKYDNALSDFNQFLQWSNQHPEGFYLKAKALLFFNRKKEARAFAQKAHSMGYTLSQEDLKPFYD
jgi:tetratricopeptide (TPR) repeat protein